MSERRSSTGASGVSARDRRALVWGAAVLAPALCWALVVRPSLAARRASEAALADQRRLMERELALLGEAARAPRAVRDAAASLRRTAPRLLPGPDPVLASAALVSYVGDAARESRVLLDRLETLPADSARGGFAAVHAVLHGQSDLAGVATLLRALETGPKLVRVDELAIERIGDDAPSGGALAAPSGAPGAASAPEVPQVVVLTMTLSGFTPVAPQPEARDSAGVAARVETQAAGRRAALPGRTAAAVEGAR